MISQRTSQPNKTPRKISVVVASKVGAPFINQCLESLQQQAAALDAEVIVIAAGADAYAADLEAKFPWARMESDFASDANTSYKRTALESVRAPWDQSFREVVVNGAPIARGEKVALRPEIVVYQHRNGLRLATAVRERYIWGRSYAVTRCQLLSNSKRMFYSALSPVLPAVMLLRVAQTAWQRRKRLGKFVGGLHYVVILLASWSFGEAIGYFTRALPRARPVS